MNKRYVLDSLDKTLKFVNKAKIAEIKPDPIKTGKVGVIESENKSV